MGTICTPAYANIFMYHFEKYIYPFLKGPSVSYLRFIDDIFFILTGSIDQRKTFFNNLNRKHSVKFEYKISQSSIPFLDTEVYIKNKKQYTKIDRTETDRQVLRVKRICLTIEKFKLYCSVLKQKFIEKGYKSELLGKHISTVEKLHRNEKLTERFREKPK